MKKEYLDIGGVTVKKEDLNTMVRAYLECALWSSTDADDDPLDDNYGLHNISVEAYTKARSTCEMFYNKCEHWLENIPYEDIGHNLWLTRNGHGTGFWDRDYTYGNELTQACKELGESHIYVQDSFVEIE